MSRGNYNYEKKLVSQYNSKHIKRHVYIPLEGKYTYVLIKYQYRLPLFYRIAGTVVSRVVNSNSHLRIGTSII